MAEKCERTDLGPMFEKITTWPEFVQALGWSPTQTDGVDSYDRLVVRRDSSDPVVTLHAPGCSYHGVWMRDAAPLRRYAPDGAPEGATDTLFEAAGLAASMAPESDVLGALGDYKRNLRVVTDPGPLYWVYRENARSTRTPPTLCLPDGVLPTLRLKYDYWWHFPHRSLADPTRIAYTPSHRHGAEDRQVVTRPGRYFKQFYGNVLCDADIRRLAALFDPPELKWATTPEDIARVYAEGPTSCMKGSTDDKFELCIGEDGRRHHPCEAYADDFLLAYLESGGVIRARALVHEDRFCTLYGGDCEILRELLKAEGCTYTSSFEGARLRVRLTGSGNYVIAPYMDGDADWLGWDDGDTHGTLYESESEALENHENVARLAETDGRVAFRSQRALATCDSCGGSCDENEITYVDSSGENVCDSCLGEHYVYAVTDGYAHALPGGLVERVTPTEHEWFRDDDDDVVVVDGQAFCVPEGRYEWFHSLGFVWDYDDEEWVDTRRMVQLARMEDLEDYASVAIPMARTPHEDVSEAWVLVFNAWNSGIDEPRWRPITALSLDDVAADTAAGVRFIERTEWERVPEDDHVRTMPHCSVREFLLSEGWDARQIAVDNVAGKATDYQRQTAFTIITRRLLCLAREMQGELVLVPVPTTTAATPAFSGEWTCTL